MSQSQSVTSAPPTQIDPHWLLSVVGRVPEANGFGIVLIDQGQVRRLRPLPTGGSDIIFERRREATPAKSIPRSDTSSAPSEWLSFGFNCGGAALAWIGVAGATSLAPVTGGMSLYTAGLFYAGVLGANAACVASIYRVSNVYRGRADINEALDKNPRYIWTMRGADLVGILGARGALTEVKKTGDILGASTLSWTRAANDTISRPMRRTLTEQLELTGAKRVSAHNINAIVKQRMLDGIAGAFGLAGSAMTGVIHELIVWIRTPEGNAS